MNTINAKIEDCIKKKFNARDNKNIELFEEILDETIKDCEKENKISTENKKNSGYIIVSRIKNLSGIDKNDNIYSINIYKRKSKSKISSKLTSKNKRLSKGKSKGKISSKLTSKNKRLSKRKSKSKTINKAKSKSQRKK